MTMTTEWNHGGLSSDGDTIVMYARASDRDADAVNLRIPLEAFKVDDRTQERLGLHLSATLESTEPTLTDQQVQRVLALQAARTLLNNTTDGDVLTALTDLATFILDGTDPLEAYREGIDPLEPTYRPLGSLIAEARAAGPFYPGRDA